MVLIEKEFLFILYKILLEKVQNLWKKNSFLWSVIKIKKSVNNLNIE